MEKAGGELDYDQENVCYSEKNVTSPKLLIFTSLFFAITMRISVTNSHGISQIYTWRK